MVNKITSPIDNLDLIAKTNEVIDELGNKQPTGNYVTLDTLQTLTSGKKIFANDAVMAGNQTALLATISNKSTATTDNAWVGRYICGAKNLTFLMGTYRTMAGIGAHSWTNAQTGSGAGWADFYLNPDGSASVYIGGNLWTKDSGWFKVKNNGNASGTVQVNRGTISSPSWKTVACWDDNVSKFTNDAGYITSAALNGYATESFVTSQGYITGITSSDVTTALEYTPLANTAALGDLSNVTISNPTAGQNLTYDATNNVWKNTSTSATVAWGGITGTLADQTDLKNALDGKYDASNPNGYTSNVGTVTSVNNVSPVDGNVTLSIPTVNNATLTIQKNGTTVKTFTANASSDVTANITVPTKISDLTDDTSTNPVDKADTLTGLTASVTELNYVDGVTSSIQTQLDGKQASLPSQSGNSGKYLTTNGSALSWGSITIPTVNNSTITIQKNSTTVDSFTLNQSSGKTINISVPTDTNDLTNGAGFITSSALSGYATETWVGQQGYALSSSLATVATSGSYNDLSNKPTIPAAQVNSDWNASSGVAQILNKPTLATVATTGAYSDLSGTPTIPTAISDLTDDTATYPIDKADYATSAGTLGSSDVGSATTPIYLDDGVATACSSAIPTQASDIGALDTNASNLSATGQTVFDGQWVYSSYTITNSKAAPTTKPDTFSLDTYLPSDGYNYEVLMSSTLTTGTTSGNYTAIALKTDIIDGNVYVNRAQTRAASSVSSYGACILPVGSARTVKVDSFSSNTGTYTLSARAYRRIGTNS